MFTHRSLVSAVYHGKSVTAFDAEIRENLRAARLADAAEKRATDRARRIENTLAYARGLNLASAR